MLDDFAAGADRAVRYLSGVAPLGAWVVALLEDDGWTPVAAVDTAYGFVLGQRLPWQDTLCSRMVQGIGAHVAAAVEPGFPAPGAGRVLVHAYLGAALTDGAGAVVGTLCGLDPAPPPPELERHLPAVHALADVLSALWRAHRSRLAADQRAAAAEAAASRCPLTGVLNRRGWLERLPELLSTGDRWQQQLALLSLDLDGLKCTNDTQGHDAGDRLLVAAAGVLRDVLRPPDLLARLGGDEFGVAAVVSGERALQQLAERVRSALRAAEVPVSVGAGLRRPGEPVEQAWRAADSAMYVDKQAHAVQRR